MKFDLCPLVSLLQPGIGRPKVGLMVMILLVGFLLCRTANAQATVRHQVFPDVVESFTHGLPFEDFSSEIGFRYYGAAAPPGAGDPCGCNGLGSDNYLLNIANSAAWSVSDPAQGPGFDHAFNNEMRFLFRGSGLDLLYAANPVGADLEWEIVDGGSEVFFTPVASGSFSTMNATSSLNTAQLVAPGSLETNKLHMLRVWPKETASPRWLSLDAIDVYDSKPFSMDDSLNVQNSQNARGTWTPSPSWGADLDASVIPAVGGGVSRSSTDGSTMTVEFNGSSLVVFGRQVAGETATFDWKVDGGGPGLQGTIDQTLDSDVANRWPHILINGLSHDEHTLVVTVKNNGGAGTAGSLGPKPQLDGGSVQLDAISVISFFDLKIAADFNVDETVNGADFLQWQRGFGTESGAVRADGDANRDRKVNGRDLQFWESEFGRTLSGVGGVSAASAATNIPEPGTATVALLALLIQQGVRRRR